MSLKGKPKPELGQFKKNLCSSKPFSSCWWKTEVLVRFARLPACIFVCVCVSLLSLSLSLLSFFHQSFWFIGCPLGLINMCMEVWRDTFSLNKIFVDTPSRHPPPGVTPPPKEQGSPPLETGLSHPQEATKEQWLAAKCGSAHRKQFNTEVQTTQGLLHRFRCDIPTLRCHPFLLFELFLAKEKKWPFTHAIESSLQKMPQCAGRCQKVGQQMPLCPSCNSEENVLGQPTMIVIHLQWLSLCVRPSFVRVRKKTVVLFCQWKKMRRSKQWMELNNTGRNVPQRIALLVLSTFI